MSAKKILKNKNVILYDTGVMSIGGNRYRTLVIQTGRGIRVEHDSLYSDNHRVVLQYSSFPDLPSNWNHETFSRWYHDLGNYNPQ